MPSRSSVAARDAGLRRVSWITRGAVAAGVVLTGAFSAIAAHAFPGRSGRAAAVPSPADAAAPPVVETTTEPSLPPTTVPVRTAAATGRRPLQPPVTAPRAIAPISPPVTAARRPVVRRVPPHVVTGGS